MMDGVFISSSKESKDPQIEKESEENSIDSKEAKSLSIDSLSEQENTSVDNEGSPRLVYSQGSFNNSNESEKSAEKSINV
jgi:hypothetical protein